MDSTQIHAPNPIYVFKTEARANWCARRFGHVQKHEVKQIFVLNRYNGATKNFYFSEEDALEVATDPVRGYGNPTIEAVSDIVGLAALHTYSQQSESDMRAEMRFESRH